MKNGKITREYIAFKDIVEHIQKTALELLKINDIVHLMPDELYLLSGVDREKIIKLLHIEQTWQNIAICLYMKFIKCFMQSISLCGLDNENIYSFFVFPFRIQYMHPNYFFSSSKHSTSRTKKCYDDKSHAD